MHPTPAQPGLFPNPVRPPAAPAEAAPSVAPRDPRARREVAIHWTPWAPRIPADAGLTATCRWSTLFGATALAATRHLLERLSLKPWDLRIRDNPAGEVIAYVADPDQPLAIVTEGLTAVEARVALDQLRRDWSRQ